MRRSAESSARPPGVNAGTPASRPAPPSGPPARCWRLGHPADAVRRSGDSRRARTVRDSKIRTACSLLAELGRCLLMAGRAHGPADHRRGAGRRPASGLTETIGELLASKGWALGESGRPVEATCCCAVPCGSPSARGCAPEFRSRMNLSAWIQWRTAGNPRDHAARARSARAAAGPRGLGHTLARQCDGRRAPARGMGLDRGDVGRAAGRGAGRPVADGADVDPPDRRGHPGR